MFDKILIANRGEIACRVIHTARRMGVRTVAVYSEADTNALHTHLADEAYCIGPAQATESYLNMQTILDVAAKTGAQAIHPGYGFLSENAAFAKACKKHGIVFIGPPAKAIEAMGSKSEAKAIMDKAGVPILPGYHGEKQDVSFLKKEAEKIGYPVLIKAVAGGGGRGMRRVNDAKDFEGELESARRESKSAFGDDKVLIEKLLTSPRHVEVQVFADAHGNGVYLFERDCSLQRRHQKVVEEAPAPGLSEKLRQQMGEAAVAAAKAVGYEGAGTVEFLFDGKEKFYFMEMNTRLQVEHPISELITHQDFVEWQLQTASGNKLPATQDELAIDGHAVEVRLYAEDADNNYLPATGTLEVFDMPEGMPGVRIDTGVTQGDTISPFYDSMIAKIIAWGEDRETAIRRLHNALVESKVAGVTTNLRFLDKLITHEAFKKGDVSTHFIEQHAKDVLPPKQPAPAQVLALLVADEMLNRRPTETKSQDPWANTDGWRLNTRFMEALVYLEEETQHTLKATSAGEDTWQVQVGDVAHTVRVIEAAPHMVASVDDTRIEALITRNGGEVSLQTAEGEWAFSRYNALDAAAMEAEDDSRLVAPTPGMVIKVMAKKGTPVKKGAGLMVLEAMKTEHHITAPTDGTVEAIHFKEGDHVEKDAVLIAFNTEEGAA